MRRFTTMALALIGAGLLTAAPVWAETITTADGVLSIDTPDETWKQTTDAGFWVTLTNGSDRITITHLSNGDPLPAVDLAGTGYAAIYQAFLSTDNEIFAVKGTAAQKADLQKLIDAIGTIKILKYDTKTRTRTAAPASTSKNSGSTQTTQQNTQNTQQTSSSSGQTIHLYTEGSYEPIYVTQGDDGFWRNSMGLTYTNNGNGVWMDANGITLYETAGTASSNAGESATDAVYTAGSNEPIYITLGSDGVWRNTMGLTFTYNGDGTWTDGNGITLYSEAGTGNTDSGSASGSGSGETDAVYTYGSYEPIYITLGDDGVWRNSFGLTFSYNGDGTWTDGNGITLYSDAGVGDYASDDSSDYNYDSSYDTGYDASTGEEDGTYYDGEADAWYGTEEDTEYYNGDEY